MITRRAAIYVRLSVTTEASVSLDRQTESARQYAAARGWEVAAVFRDDGVSASHHKPEARAGWRALLDSPERFDTVIIWKLDRLARRVLDFHTANESLIGRGAALVAVENSIDMATPDGKLIANVLASFAEYEADAIRSRVKAAREHLIRAGRVVGGTIPNGWRSIKNPDGPGYVLAHDSERIDWVRGMADRALAGESIYSITKWLSESDAPLPVASQVNRSRTGWHHSTVERLLRNPILAGMTRYNPGGTRHAKPDPSALLRDPDTGIPVVDESIAIMTPDEWRILLATLDARNTAQTMPRAAKGTTSPLLAGLARCNDCDRVMNRGTKPGRAVLTCPQCHQTIAAEMLGRHLTERLLVERGSMRNAARGPAEDVGPALTALEHAIQGVAARLTSDDADVGALTEQLAGLKAERQAVRDREAHAPAVGHSGRFWLSKTIAQQWAAATSDIERRAVLAGQLQSLRIARGRRGGRTLDATRVRLEWKPTLQEYGRQLHNDLGEMPLEVKATLSKMFSPEVLNAKFGAGDTAP